MWHAAYCLAMEADLEASMDCDVLTDETDSSLSLITEASSGSLSQQLVQKKNTTSQVWRYFGFEPDSNGRPKNCDSPKCKLCLLCVTAKWGNTSNLLNHLRKHHPQEYGIVKSTTGTKQQQRQH